MRTIPRRADAHGYEAACLGRALAGVLAAAALLLAGCVTLPSHGAAGRLVSRDRVSPSVEQIVVNAGGRDITCLVLLPPGYDAGRRYPTVVAIHNFGGDARGFADLIHADRLLARGAIVLAPQAGGATRDWKGPGVTLLAQAVNDGGEPVDDIAGVAGVIESARGLYGIAPDDLNVVGFSQGATLALALTRRLNEAHAGTVRRLFLAAGSLAGPADAGLALTVADLVAYEPGHNWPQLVADLRTGEPTERIFLPRILAAKSCHEIAHEAADGLDRRTYACGDGARVLHIFEARGEHAWPGQDAKYDSWITGRGSTSALDFTTLITDWIAPRGAP